MKRIKELIDKHCRNKEIGLQNGLDALLDYMIDFFDYSHYLNDNIEKHWQDMLGKSRELFIVTIDFMERAAKAIEQGTWIDYFGQLYESQYQSKGKASNLGQFFTPPDICNLMADVSRCKKEDRINDPACGSGRTLLSYFAKAENKSGYYVGEDIDITSVKMAALNMMIHGMRGRAIRHDTLKDPITFELGYEINEVRYPCPTPYYSLRRISNATKDDSK